MIDGEPRPSPILVSTNGPQALQPFETPVVFHEDTVNTEHCYFTFDDAPFQTASIPSLLLLLPRLQVHNPLAPSSLRVKPHVLLHLLGYLRQPGSRQTSFDSGSSVLDLTRFPPSQATTSGSSPEHLFSVECNQFSGSKLYILASSIIIYCSCVFNFAHLSLLRSGGRGFGTPTTTLHTSQNSTWPQPAQRRPPP